MKFNQKLINQLAAGEIVIRTTPETIHLTRELLKEAFPKDAYLDQGDIKSNWTYRAACHDNTFCVDGNPDGLKEVLAKDFLLPEPRFKVGDTYEFSNNGEEWIKGTLLAIIDHTAKYVAKDTFGSGRFCMNIREIQSKEVTIERWINMSQSGNQVGKKCFESEMEACQHAPQSQKVFQVKLTGTYKI